MPVLQLLTEKGSKTRKEKKHKHKEATGAPFFPTGKGGGGGGILCMYNECENEAKYICPYCYLLFCKEHKEQERHQCIPLYRVLSKLKNIPEIRERLTELGENVVESPHFKYGWKYFSRKQLFQKLASVTHKYREFFQNFTEKALTTPNSITNCDVIMFIYARLVSKLLEFSEKYNKVIVMDHNLLECLSTGNPPCDHRLAGIAFQWWLTLELLDSLHNKGYIENIEYELELFKRKVPIIKEKEKLILYLDSHEVMIFLGLRPDILSTKELESKLGKVIEVKLSYNALKNSYEQIIKYIGIWGSKNIVIAIGFPSPHLELLEDHYIKIIDSIVIMDNESLQKTIDKFISHLTSL